MRLETERLLLRKPEPADLDTFARFYADPEVMRYLGHGRVLTRADTETSLVRTIARFDADGFGLCTVERKSDGAVVGRVGLLVWDTSRWEPVARAEAGPKMSTEIELGWTLGRPYWRNGYATEAALAARDFAFGDLGLTRLVSLIAPANEASIAVSRRLGMTLERSDLEPFGYPVGLYALAAAGNGPAR